MFKWIRESLNKDEGFTLVELMVVVLIIAILIAIAIPTFLGARQRAQDRAAQSDLRNALTAAKVFYTDTEDYDATAVELEAIEPSLTWGAIAAADADTVGFLVEDVVALDNDNNIFTAAKQSASGTWFCISDTSIGAASGTYYQSGAALANVDTGAECNGSEW
jgi:type IV pilus assembly protein PilA